MAPHSYARLIEGDLYGTCAPIENLRELNAAITPILNSLKETPYFRTYKINLERECPFWAQQRLCNNQQCAVCECEDRDVPEFWAGAQEASQPVGFGHAVTKQPQKGGHFTDSFFDVGNKGPARDNNVEFDCPESYAEWCVEDFDTSKGGVAESDYVIVNLLENPETYTAYLGSPIWDAIYQENCLLDKTFGKLQGIFNSGSRYKEMLNMILDQAESCTDETLLYYLMSGLHASVNTHISNAFVDPDT